MGKRIKASVTGRSAFEIFMCVLGAFIYSAGVSFFTVPHKFAAGGVTGIGIIVNHLLSWIPIGSVVLLLNIPLFIVAWRVFGFKFIARTVITTVFNSFFIDLLGSYEEKFCIGELCDENLLAAVFGGLLMGAGLGMVFMHGGTTGGFDIIARLLRLKFPYISMGKLMMFCDFAVIIFTGILYRSAESVMFSLISLFLSSQAIDYIIAGKSHSKLLFIITNEPDKVCADIISLCGRGVSIIHSAGGYTKTERDMLMCVVRVNEVAAVKQIVESRDDSPFIIVADSSEVLGKGFKSYKDTL